MSHSVRRHLRVETAAYDDAIRRFIPGYETMLQVAAEAVAAVRPRLVLDLGAGTGALSAALLEPSDTGSVALVDVDPEMLDQARERLAPFGDRARFLEQSFHDPLPPCDAIAASLSLHHVPTLAEKQNLYRRIFNAMNPGGVFVNADAVMPSDPVGRSATYDAWAQHMAKHGIERPQAFQHFEEWAEEDTYFPLEDELAALRTAGFEAECPWHRPPMAVVAGRKRVMSSQVASAFASDRIASHRSAGTLCTTPSEIVRVPSCAPLMPIGWTALPPCPTLPPLPA